MEEKDQYIEKMNSNLSCLKDKNKVLFELMKECKDSETMDKLLDLYNSINKVLNMVSLTFAINAVLLDMNYSDDKLNDKTFTDEIIKYFYSADYIPKKLKQFAKKYLKGLLLGELNPFELVEESKQIIQSFVDPNGEIIV